MQVSDDPRVGTELAGYRLESLLGRDGSGAVYLAEDLRLERTVAVRLLAEGYANDERSRERFLRESNLVASLEHPNILPVYEAGEADGLLFVAMGIVDGRDLASLLACEGRLAPERALRIVAQLAEALDTARWSRGLVHGAVRPSEVLIVPAAEPAPGERVLLAGFGLRQEPPYLTPEQIEGRPVSPRSDVYALACVLFECLTGKPPFSGDPETVRRAHLREPPPSAARYCHALPRGIDRVIGTAMSKWPEERYSTCAELAASAQAALAGRAQPGRARSDEYRRRPNTDPVTPVES